MRESYIMTSDQLKNVRKSQGITQTDMAAMLETAKRTYQDWEAGNTRIPGFVAVGLCLLLERSERTMAETIRRCKDRIAREFPSGILSELEDEEG